MVISSVSVDGVPGFKNVEVRGAEEPLIAPKSRVMNESEGRNRRKLIFDQKLM